MKNNLLRAALPGAALLTCLSLPAQSGLRASLAPERGIVSGREAILKLVLEATQDTEVDAALVNGLSLTTTVEGEEGRPIRQAGKGGKDLPELAQGMMEGGAKGKTSGVLEGAVEKVDDLLGKGRDRRDREEEPAPRRRPRPRRREDDE